MEQHDGTGVRMHRSSVGGVGEAWEEWEGSGEGGLTEMMGFSSLLGFKQGGPGARVGYCN